MFIICSISVFGFGVNLSNPNPPILSKSSSISNALFAPKRLGIGRNSSLNEELNKRTKELDTTSKQLDSTKELVEKYRRSYKSLKENYVELKATSYGLKKEEVLKRLGESYKIKDIEPICEELSQYKTNMRKLPFRLTEDTKVSVKASKNEYIRGNTVDFGDDTVTSSLLQLADIK